MSSKRSHLRLDAVQGQLCKARRGRLLVVEEEDQSMHYIWTKSAWR